MILIGGMAQMMTYQTIAVLEMKVKKMKPVHVRCNVLASPNFIHIKSQKVLIGR